jgi:hypothetical protein
MADASLTIQYTITTITTANGMSTIVWSMFEAISGETSSRTGDRFKTSDLADGVESTDADYDKILKLQANFEALAEPYFRAFAIQCRAAMDAAFVEDLETIVDTVEGFSVGGAIKMPITGSVTVS